MVKLSLCNAIKNRQQVSMKYEGQRRVVDPYLIGITTAGNEALRAYQVEGYSSSGNLPAWRLFNLRSITEVEILDTSFRVNAQYNPNDKGMARISCRVETA